MLFTLADIDDLLVSPSFKIFLMNAYPSTAQGLLPMVLLHSVYDQTTVDLFIEIIMGYINVIVMELNLVTLHRRNMLLCTEWYASHFLFVKLANCLLQLRYPALRQRDHKQMQTV